jgi:hypothetical protein
MQSSSSIKQTLATPENTTLVIALLKANPQTSGDRRNLTCLSLVELLAVAPSG